ncbi:MAG: hypothetical protein DRO99_03170 [Candidatus Aenigmatarchaeota archaeon]|nr:MAG: hypothetical protein DRO99_03170 [Candidatus Aenigmarchaeota archaeon]
MGVPQFHPGKVTEVYQSKGRDIASSDASTQATVSMWDGHTLTITVAPRLRSKIRRGDVVFVDYYPSSKFRDPVPRMVITKIIRGSKAKSVLQEYGKYHRRIKSMKPEGPSERVHERYIG